MNPASDPRHVLTLDAGGTTFAFHAIRGNEDVAAPVVRPSYPDDLKACLDTLVEGFEQQRQAVGGTIQAISFAFPGPADYAAGIIGDLQNLPAFRGGVALGPMLEDRFGVPVYLNNDGDLFAYGEALSGLLPEINGKLEAAGNPKRFQNLLGLTLGTGFGGGIVRQGQLFRGDNGAAGEIWCTRHKLHRDSYAEEGVSVRAVKRAYATGAGLRITDQVPDPREIAAIAEGLQPGSQGAACESFRLLGEVAGDAIANAISLVDGLVVLGGGLSGAWPHFMPALLAELNGQLTSVTGRDPIPRTELAAFNLEDEAQMARFLRGRSRHIVVPGSGRLIPYDPMKRIGIGISKLGASRAVALGAYAFALDALDRNA